MTRYLVTGAGGFIGTALVRELRIRGADVIEMGSSNGDVTNVDHWRGRLEGVDVVFHLAARETVNNVPADVLSDWNVNAGSVLCLGRACELAEVRPRVVFTSSTNLVGCPDHSPITEATADAPLTIYAVHKRTGEDYLRLSTLPSVILRLPNVYGDINDRRLEQRSTINRMIGRAIAGLPLATYANEDCVRDFMHVDDVIAALIASVPTAAIGSSKFVIGTGEAIRLGDAVRLIAARAGRDSTVSSDPGRPLTPVEFRNIVVDSSAFQDATGWRPIITFADGIVRTIEAMREEAP